MLHASQPSESDAIEREAETVSANSPPVRGDLRAGRKLTEARVRRGWTLDEVADRIRVRREFLQALEEMNAKVLPGRAYALAFLRSYARELGIDEQAIVEQFQLESALTRAESAKPVRTQGPKLHRERPWRIAAALLALAAAFVGWRMLSPPNTAQMQAGAERAGGLGLSPAAYPAAEENRIVEVKALSDARLEARGPDGTVFLYRTLRSGEVYRPDPSPGWTLHAADGGAFELYVNGVSAGLLGTPGMPVLGRSIDDVKPLTQAELATPRS